MKIRFIVGFLICNVVKVRNWPHDIIIVTG